MDGIELNRPDHRKKFNIKTKFRPLGTNYGKHDGNFIAEHEEVVVSTDTFSYEDFLEIRSLNFMFYAVFSLNFQKWFFQFIRYQNIPLSDFFSKFSLCNGLYCYCINCNSFLPTIGGLDPRVPPGSVLLYSTVKLAPLFTLFFFLCCPPANLNGKSLNIYRSKNCREEQLCEDRRS